MLLAGLTFSQLLGASEVKKKWQASTAVSYETGKFGTADRSSTFYFPFSIRRYFSRGDMTFTVPFLRLRTTGQTTVVDGRPQRIRQGRQTTIASTGTVTNSGLGDLLLSGRFYLVEEEEWYPTINVVGKIKFPTASFSKGLGTREFDETVGGELGKWFFDHLNLFADVNYTFIGDPPNQPLNNQFMFDVGAGYLLTPKLFASALYEERTALLDGQPNSRLLLFGSTYSVNKTIRLNGSILTGLSDGAPDFGLTVGLDVRF